VNPIRFARDLNRYPPNTFYKDDLVKYRGIVYRVTDILPNKRAVLELETLAMPVIKEAREASAVIVEYRRDPKNPTSINDDGKIEYMVMASLDELKLVQLDNTPEAHERLRQYVQERLRASGVDEYHANPVNPDSVAAHIVADAWRQYDRKKYADMGIEQAIKYPPLTIDNKHFSLRSFIKERE
jgi:hypothetical protein